MEELWDMYNVTKMISFPFSDPKRVVRTKGHITDTSYTRVIVYKKVPVLLNTNNSDDSYPAAATN